ncbi:uncharacterized protein LOC112091954 [Morus notabilis]|uniref:uncharacterized protein LOC112091954 n=1 Tax=Morus notabilis TaxID=981085 RepID=UPI000CED0922|nr:uncharacterized protein LOC112091954 [Morus notabilis]
MQPQGSANESHEVESSRTRRRRRGFRASIRLATAAAIVYDEYRVPRPMHNSALRGIDKVNELLANTNEAAMFNKVRMGPRAFRILCEILIERGLLQPTNNMNVPEQVFVFLTIVAQSQTNRESQDVWQHSGETISRRFSDVLGAICALHDDFIKPPNYDKVSDFVRGNRHRYGTWFNVSFVSQSYQYATTLVYKHTNIFHYGSVVQDCIGAIDRTHIPCTPIGVQNQTAYRNRKGFNSLNVMAACSFDMKFTYIFSGWEGSAHDARVLADAVAEPKFKFPHPPPGKYYLVDAAYANNSCFLAPYRGGTYHLPDYQRRSGGFKGPKDVFNYKHSSLRNCIERTFGVWKARFPILRRTNNTYPMTKQVKIPVACAILHNFIHIVNEGDSLLNQYYRDGVPVSEIDPTNSDGFDDDDDDDNVPEEPTVTGATVSRTEMGHFRDRLANDMWVEYQRSRGRQG